MNQLSTIFLSLLGGVLPALLWLWFWLKEDKLHPEPKGRILLVFIGGMASVFIVLPIEKFFFTTAISSVYLLTILLWAGIEEISKYAVAYFTALRNKVTDEPIDAVIYMITAALGFSALENTLFIFNLVDDRQFLQSILTGNSRFLGATLLHVASSAAVGVMLGLSFYKKPYLRKIYLCTGIALAVILHTVFNLLIIKLENGLFFIFTGVWILIILLIVLIEKIKKVRYQ
jgi:RsiW-degrading membrane proteinase PrsW (M82 family)